MPSDIAKNWKGAACNLNGQIAEIRGWKNQFATIWSPISQQSGEWSWVAVNRIMSQGGNFQL